MDRKIKYIQKRAIKMVKGYKVCLWNLDLFNLKKIVLGLGVGNRL